MVMVFVVMIMMVMMMLMLVFMLMVVLMVMFMLVLVMVMVVMMVLVLILVRQLSHLFYKTVYQSMPFLHSFQYLVASYLFPGSSDYHGVFVMLSDKPHSLVQLLL